MHFFAQERFTLECGNIAEHLRCESLVDFPEVNIIERQTVAREQARDGVGGCHEQTFGKDINTGNLVVEQFHARLVRGQFGKACFIRYPDCSGTVG